uniref:Uncharacterized protein n=1 Tax=Oncorhynchus tshawytscha TaxID=74940 RepID=A0A8C8MGM0_ONCTS
VVPVHRATKNSSPSHLPPHHQDCSLKTSVVVPAPKLQYFSFIACSPSSLEIGSPLVFSTFISMTDQNSLSHGSRLSLCSRYMMSSMFGRSNHNKTPFSHQWLPSLYSDQINN